MQREPIKPDFQSKILAHQWLKLFHDHPFGDYYRLALINPLVLQVALWAMQRKGTGALPPPPVDLGTAIFTQLADTEPCPNVAFERILVNLRDTAYGDNLPLNGLRVADLGCGNGYLGPLLTSLGANYLGVDKQPAFIADAIKRHGNKDGPQLYKACDLDNATTEFKGLFSNGIDLALSIMVLEHLAHPEHVLQQIRSYSSESGIRPALLLITENSDYYRTTAHTKGDNFSVREGEVPIVCLGGTTVDVRWRNHIEISKLLRDVGYTVLEEGYQRLPGHWPSFTRNYYGCNHLDSVNWGLSPFRSMIAIPLPPAKRSGTVSFSELVNRSVLASVQCSGGTSLLRRIEDLGTFIDVKSEEPIITRHDVGGCLFIVTNGLCYSRHQPEILFEQFDFFGELEANRGDHKNAVCGFFVHDVCAGKEGAEIFVIPEAIASELLAKDFSLLSILFSELRRKVLLRNDRLTLRSLSDRGFDLTVAVEPSPDTAALPKALTLTKTDFFLADVHKYDLGRLAGALLSLSEIESQIRDRSSGVRVVFSEPERIRGIAEIAEQTKATEKMLRLLCMLGVVDGIPPLYFRFFKDRNGKLLSETFSSNLILHINASVVSELNALGNDISDLEKKRIIGKIDLIAGVALSHKSIHKTGGRPTSFFAEIESAIEECVNLVNDKVHDEVKAISASAANRLLQMNALIMDKTPRFFVIHDIPFLRLLAYAPSQEIDRTLFVRALAQMRNNNDILSFKELARAMAGSDDAHGRVPYYAAVFSQFIRKDWQSRGRLLYSGDRQDGVMAPF